MKEGGGRELSKKERKREGTHLGDEIASARYINNDIGVFTSAHRLGSVVQGRLL